MPKEELRNRRGERKSSLMDQLCCASQLLHIRFILQITNGLVLVILTAKRLHMPFYRFKEFLHPKKLYLLFRLLKGVLQLQKCLYPLFWFVPSNCLTVIRAVITFLFISFETYQHYYFKDIFVIKSSCQLVRRSPRRPCSRLRGRRDQRLSDIS